MKNSKNGLLVKFTDSAFLSDVANGSIHFESLGKYQGMEMFDGNSTQGDLYEGGIRSFFPHFEENGEFTEFTEIITITEYSKQTYVTCFVLLEFGSEIIFNSDKKTFFIRPEISNDLKEIAGDRPAVIFELDNVIKEISRYQRLCRIDRRRIRFDRVEYIENNLNIPFSPYKIDIDRAFYKDFNYLNQHEWRIACVISKKHMKPFNINLNLDGIVISGLEELKGLQFKKKIFSNKFKIISSDNHLDR